MTNAQIIYDAICAEYTAAQRHELAAHYFSADEITTLAAKTKADPDESGKAPDPVELAEALLCVDLFHTFSRWKRDGLSVKRGEKAAISCRLWKYRDDDKSAAPDADGLTKAAAEQENRDCYMTTAYLFGRWQVEKTTPRPAGRFKSMEEIKAYNKMLADQRKADKARAIAQQAAEQAAAEQSARAAAAVVVEERHELPQLAKAPQLPAKKASKGKAPESIKIVLHNNPANVMELYPGFFPCGAGQLKQIMKLVREDTAHADEITAQIIDILTRKASADGLPDQAAARRNLVALGAIEAKRDENPVKVSGKPELFEAFLGTKDDPRRQLLSGYRAQYAGYNFFFVKRRGGGSWEIYEARAGLRLNSYIHKTKAACAEYIKEQIKPGIFDHFDFEAAEKRKAAAPARTVYSID